MFETIWWAYGASPSRVRATDHTPVLDNRVGACGNVYTVTAGADSRVCGNPVQALAAGVRDDTKQPVTSLSHRVAARRRRHPGGTILKVLGRK